MSKNKISFYQACGELEAICEQVDDLEGDELGPLVQELLNRSQGNVTESVDRRINYIRFADSQAAMAREMRNTWGKRLRTFEKIAQNIKDNTLAIIKTNPGIPFAGTTEKFRLQKNPQPKLIHPLEISKQYIEAVEVDSFIGMMDEYLVKKHYWILDKDALKKDLKSGKEILGASLEQGEHVRIGLK